MREIKFRGRNKDIGWAEGQVAYDLNGDTYIIREVEQDSSYGLEEAMLFATIWYRVDKETVGQYTGLHDKNGKEIYEGDIIKCYSEIYVVEFRENRGGFFPFACGDGCGCCEHEVAWADSSEVIGNIWEDSDLLNDSKNTKNNKV